ncbi:MAG: transposase [Pseudonocardiaceae bacterium]
MSERRRKYTPEFKDEAAKMVIETSRPIAEVAREIGVHEGTLGNWVAKYRVDHAGEEPPLSITDRARLRELEKENRELKMKAEFLGKAAAFFAQESEPTCSYGMCTQVLNDTLTKDYQRWYPTFTRTTSHQKLAAWPPLVFPGLPDRAHPDSPGQQRGGGSSAGDGGGRRSVPVVRR